MNANLYEAFRERFPADRTRTFIETIDGRRFSYADLEEASGRMARLLHQLGVQPGDRVAVQVEKSPAAVFLNLACLRTGAVLLPLNTAYQSEELDYFLGDAEPAVVVCRPVREAEVGALAAARRIPTVLTLADDGESGTLVERARGLDPAFPACLRAPNDLAAILYSSGTTGRPKGAMLSHRNLAANARTLHRIWGFRPDDVLLHALPIFHTHGLFVAINCVLMNGSGMLFLPRFDLEAVIARLPRATVFMGVPTYYTRLLADPRLTPELCRNMRLFISGSAPLLTETFHAFRARTGHTILERYGMTETGMNTSNPLDGERRAGTVGFPLPDVELHITHPDTGAVLGGEEVGMIEVRGPNVFRGYWRMPEKTRAEFTADGFFRTGDLGRIDADGYVHIVGRAKDLIISGGYNVYPKEIEDVIDRINGVLESAVVGMPHPDFGEAGLAVVVRRDGRNDPTAETVLQTLRGKLANYKIPKQVVFVDSLPRNAMGKVQKAVLREQFAELWSANLKKAS